MFSRNLYFALIVLLLFIFSASIYAENQSLTTLHTLNDGPHVFVSNEKMDAYWVCKGQVVSLTLPRVTLPFLTEACDMSAQLHETMSAETKILEYKGDFTVAALSDFHGQYDLMLELLKNNHIIDSDKHWAFGNGHFVITGDIFDRGTKVTEILWFLYDLERQAELAGGKIHLTLGNHEVMILNGNFKYLAPKYKDVAKKLNRPYETLFSKDSVLGNWLRSKPVLVKVNDMLFAHGGFHPKLAKDNLSIEEINHIFKANLVEVELGTPREGLGKYLHKTDGPIWYRGYFAKERKKDNGATLSEINLLLEHFDVKHIIVGHTSQKQIETRFGGKIIAIDSSIKNGKYGEILFIDKEKKWRGSLTGEKLKLD
ncbi:metallophosphoesterase [Paraglaciecola arctica]|uniref:Calcineurin-like phosphoesterase domain-containing protein n=1 Tax=Paraglaciecola arctica BSs20135 TaxID=493475 RepID=K6Y1H7_9ALTE|nr:metallophosphoesterase [Paraglaciecola arctica]GAC17766.1 hypothetical protein GARC_0785 [Paraglaciecola arctica BSs20135]